MSDYSKIISENNATARELISVSKNLIRSKDGRERIKAKVSEAIMDDTSEATLQTVAIQEQKLFEAREEFREVLREQAEHYLENKEQEDEEGKE